MKTTRITDNYRQLDKTTGEDNQNTDRYYRQIDKTTDKDNQNNRQILQTARQNYR